MLGVASCLSTWFGGSFVFYCVFDDLLDVGKVLRGCEVGVVSCVYAMMAFLCLLSVDGECFGVFVLLGCYLGVEDGVCSEVVCDGG